MKKDRETIQYKRILGYFYRHIKRHPQNVSIITVGVIAGSILGALAPTYLKQLIDLLTSTSTADRYSAALGILGMYMLYKVGALLLNRLTYWNLALIDAKVMASLRESAFGRLIQHSHSFFVNNFAGSLTQRINKFSKSYEAIWDVWVMQIVPLLLWVGTALYIVSKYSVAIALVLLGGIVFFFGFNFVFIRYKSKYDKAASDAETRVGAGLADSISNHLTIQLFTGASAERARIRGLVNDLRNKKIAQWLRGEVMFGTQAVMLTLVEYLMFRYSIVQWRAGLLTTGTIVLFQIYVFGLVSRLFDFSQVFRRLSESFSDAQEMMDIIDMPLEVTDHKAVIHTPPTRGEIEFKDVAFGYSESAELISHLSLAISRGEKVALVGVSGAGKSTLFKMLLRLYDRTGGELLIDGEPIEHYTQEAVRAGISFVPQEPALFHRSLMENIRYGKADASDQTIFDAAAAAECLDFIENLPHRFETLVGERGVKLSGGERQRVAIARAIVKNAPILLLDEATSALDSHSELQIQRSLDRLMEQKTVIAIAHRLSTIKKMDRIIVMQRGTIVEEGTHESLLTREGGIYRKLWELQVDGFIQDETKNEA
jgi:ATP-binding cassette subfamily B protein